MKKIHGRTLFILFAISGAIHYRDQGFGISGALAAQSAWPFDQRQIVLAHKGDTDFPDDRTVAQIMDEFVRLGRVKWVTQKAGAAQIVPMDVPADFPWQSAPSVRQLGLRYTADGILTLVRKGVQVTLEWYGTVDGQPLFFETVSLPEATKTEDIEARKKRLLAWVDEIWAKIPGVGYAIKRDMSTVTVEGVDQVGLQLGHELEFRRLEKMERHPLLKTLVGITSSVTGRGVVKEVSKNFATVDITYESQVDPIQAGDRYAILGKKDDKDKKAAAAAAASVKPSKEKKDDKGRSFIPLFDGEGDAGEKKTEAATKPKDLGAEPKYKILDVTGYVGFGKVSHSETSAGSADARTLSALAPTFGLKILSYITREAVLAGDVGFSLVNFHSPPADYNVGSLSSGLTTFRIGAGYRFMFSENSPTNGEIIVSAGYRRMALSMAQAPVNFAPTAKTYSGIDLGLSLVLPVQEQFKLHLSGARILSASLAETPQSSGAGASNSVWSFEAGGNYLLNPTNEILVALKFDSASSTFKEKGERGIQALSTTIQSTIFVAGYTLKF